MFKINYKNRRHWRRSGVIIVNFEHLFLAFLLLTLNTRETYQVQL